MPDAPPADPSFAKVREALFRGELAARMTARDPAAEASGAEVAGVVIEIGTPRGIVLVYGMRDGTASMLWSTGGGLVGGRERPRIAAAARALAEEARGLVGVLPQVDSHPLPEPGRVRVSILTSNGVLAGEDAEQTLMAGQGALHGLFLRGNDIAVGFRAEPRPDAKPLSVTKEAAYVTCLLTALARGHVRSVTLYDNAPVPDPAGLTREVRDLEWFNSLRFDLATLSAAAVMAHVYIYAGFRELPEGQLESRLRATLQSYEDAHRKTYAFRVTQREHRGAFGLEVASLED